jgi:hypothetical protein
MEELLAAHPGTTDMARFKMFREWLEDSPEIQKGIDTYFFNNHAPPSYDGRQ